MKTRDEKAILMKRIIYLQNKQSFEFQELKQQFEMAYDSIKPANIIKSSIQSIIASPDIKSDIVNGAIGFGVNYLSKNLLNPESKNPIKKILGKGLRLIIKNFIDK